MGHINMSHKAVPIMNSNGNYRAMNNKVVTLTGSDFLGQVDVSGELSASSAIRRAFPVSPSAYPGTRITQLADLWERYRFRRFALRYVPSVPNTLACQVLVYQDTDPNDDPSTITDLDALIRQGVSQAGSQQWNFNSSKVVNLAKRADNELYYTGVTKQNERFNYQGTAYLLQVTTPLDFNGTPVSGDLQCGSLYLDWECEFQTPQINPSAIAEKSVAPLPTDFSVDQGTTAEFTVPAGYTAQMLVSAVDREYIDPGLTTSVDYKAVLRLDSEPYIQYDHRAFSQSKTTTDFSQNDAILPGPHVISLEDITDNYDSFTVSGKIVFIPRE